MSSRLRVIDNHLPQIRRNIELIVTEISKDCLSKSIISNEIHQNVLQSRKLRRDRTIYLLSHVQVSLEEDDSKCEQFIQILNRYRSCRLLVERIRQDIDKENRSLISQEHGSKMGASNVISMVLGSNHSNRHPTPNRSALSTATCDTSCTPQELAHEKNCANLDREQLKAKIAALQKENEEIQAKSKETQKERDIANAQKMELKNEFISKDKELEKLTKEREDFMYTIDCLKLRISMSEKDRHTEENMKRMISEHDKKIGLIKEERDATCSDLKSISTNYEKLRERVDTLETKAIENNALRQKLRQEEKEDGINHNQEQHCAVCIITKQMMNNRELILTILSVVILILAFIFHLNLP